jgi:3-methyladenine DNA glycosylase AlkD
MATPQTGWADEFVKKLAKIVPDQFFLSKLAHTVEKVAPKIWAIFVFLERLSKVNNRPNAENLPKIRRKFARSGHPDHNL